MNQTGHEIIRVQEADEKQERKDIIDYTLYTISKRRERRKYYKNSLIFAVLIFIFSVAAGGFAFILFDRYTDGEPISIVNALIHSPFVCGTVKEFTRALLLRFMGLEIFILLHFASGFTPITQWFSGIVLLAGSSFSGFLISYFAKAIFSAADFNGSFVLTYMICIVFLSLFCVLNIFMASIASSFHAQVKFARRASAPIREEEVGEFFTYFLNISAYTLLLTLVSSFLFWLVER